MLSKIIKEKSEWFSFLKLRESGEKLDELMSSNWFVIYEKILYTSLMTHCCHNSLGFDLDSILWHWDILILVEPCSLREGAKSKHGLIKVDDL